MLRRLCQLPQKEAVHRRAPTGGADGPRSAAHGSRYAARSFYCSSV